MLNSHSKKTKAFLGNKKVKKAYIGDRRVYSAGNIVTYHIDTGVTPIMEEVDSDASCLSPSFIPTKSGWEFIGWSDDKTASESAVLPSKIMGDEPVTLYAVFKKTVNANFKSYNKSEPSTGIAYYNNANIAQASILIPTGASYPEWNWRGWSQWHDTNAKADPKYDNGDTVSIHPDNDGITFYGLYSKVITVTYFNNSTTSTTAKDTRYFNAYGNYTVASFKLVQKDDPNWTERGWSTTNRGDAEITYDNNTTFERDSDITLYGLYSQTITLSYSGNSNTGGNTEPQTGTRYWAPAGSIDPSFRLRSNGFTKTGYSFNKWAMGSTSGTQYAASASVTLTVNTTFYALWTDNAWTWVSNYVGSGASLLITITKADNCKSLSTGTLSRFDVASYHEDSDKAMGIDFHTNTVSTKGCKYMTFTFPDFLTGTNNDGVVRSYFRVMSSGDKELMRWTDRVYGGTRTIDVSSASSVYIDCSMGAWAQSESPCARVQAIAFSN